MRSMYKMGGLRGFWSDMRYHNAVRLVVFPV